MGFFNKLFKRNVEGIVAPNQYYNPTTDDYEVIQGSNGAAQVSLAGSNVPDSQAIPVKISGADSTGGAVNTNVKGSDIIQPVDIQARYAQTIQMHNAVSVPATTGTSASAWIDCNGFSEIAYTLMNDAGTTNYADIHWSHDGVTYHSAEFGALPSNNAQRKAVNTPVKARYSRLNIANTDASAHIMSSWAYLKA
jgi:hypothetical protein